MENKKVVVFGRSNPVCPYCENAKVYLEENNISYDYKDISQEAYMVEFQERYLSKGIRSVPQISVDGVEFGGFDNITSVLELFKEATVRDEGIFVIKRSGDKVLFDEDKLNKWAEWAANSNVPWSTVVFQAMKQVGKDCTTKDIQDSLIKVCVDKLDLPHLDMAARLLVGKLYKEVHGSFDNLPEIGDFYHQMVSQGMWVDMDYSEEELDYLENIIDHNKNFTYKYQTVKQIADKYLLQDKVNKRKFETPQFMYMGVAMANMAKMPKERRLVDVVNLYTALSDLKLNAPTPILGNTRTKNRGLASCAVFTTEDTADSIGTGPHIAYKMTNANAGIGAYLKCRSLGDDVRSGSIEHTGKLPYYRFYASAVKATKQPQRGGSMTMFYTVLDPELPDLLKLKHVTTPLEKRIRDIDYSCVLNKYFVKKALKNEQWMLISIKDAPDLWEALYDPTVDFEELYTKYEKSSAPKTFVSAREIAITLETQWHEAGRVYKMWADEVNFHTPFKQPIYSSNLCKEVGLPTKGFNDVDELYMPPEETKSAGEIALCFLSAIVAGRVTHEEYEELAYYALLMIDNTIDNMEYPFKNVAHTASARRSVGVGIVNLAAAMAESKVKYTSQEGKKFIHDHAEMHSYYLHKGSLRLAKERGNAEWIHKTKYPEGWLPVDTYNKNVDSLAKGLNFDWETLRKDIIEQGGIRHSVLEAHMPAEASAVASCATNGIYPMREAMVVKGGTRNRIPCFVPESDNPEVMPFYESAWDIPHKDITDLYALVQKFTGQMISADYYFNPANYPNRKRGTKEMLQNLAYATKMGVKTHYYMNTKSGKDEELVEKEQVCDSGGCDV